LTKTDSVSLGAAGGTTLYFVNDGIESALRQAREVDEGKDIRIAGGVNTILKYLNAAWSKLSIALAPFFLAMGSARSTGSTGVRLHWKS